MNTHYLNIRLAAIMDATLILVNFINDACVVSRDEARKEQVAHFLHTFMSSGHACVAVK